MDILSVTTTKKRLDLLCIGLQSIARQSHLPDLILINLDREAFSDTQNLLAVLQGELNRELIRINLVKDVGPHTKLLPALAWLRSEEDRVITIDDDIFYHPDFLENLIALADANPDAIVCGRARRIRRNIIGGYTSYRSWPIVNGPTRGRDLLPLGVGGVVYRKQLLDVDLIDTANILDLAPKADDLAFRILSLTRGVDVIVDPRISAKNEAVDHPYGLTTYNSSASPMARLMRRNKFTHILLRGMRYLGFPESNNDRQWRRLVSKIDVRL